MTNVKLTNNPMDQGKQIIFFRSDCACDCDCACPTAGLPTPTLSLPVAYYLELTPICNSHCPGCGNIYASERKYLPQALDAQSWCSLIARLAPHVQQFKLTGGEATLHPGFSQIVQLIDKLGIPFTLFSNGRWTHADDLIQLLVNTAACEGLLISLHGPDAATHETFSGVVRSFDQTVNNIQRATKANLNVATSFVINQSNWNKVEATLNLATSLGVNHMVCNRLIGETIPGITPSPTQLKCAVITIQALRDAGYPIRFGNCIPQCFEISSSRGCTAGRTFATIDPWGRLRPCNHTSLIAGDLQISSIEEIWQNGTMNQWRSLISAECTTCSAFAFCHGGCQAQALITGLAKDPLMTGITPDTFRLAEAQLSLYAELRPVGVFKHETMKDFNIVIYGSHVAAVPPEFEKLISQLNGSLTLRQINDLYSHIAVDWVGTLHQEGMVTWASEVN